jgi:hypothetical protein
MYILYLPVIGKVVFHLASIRFHGFNIYALGYDEDHNSIDLTLDKLSYPEGCPEDCGYCHIISYTMNGQTVQCNYYRSIH